MGISTSELLELIDIPRQKLYYLETKGFIKPKRIRIGEKEFREYSEADVELIRLIWRYLKEGYKYRTALDRAMEDIKTPQLDLMGD